MSPAPNGCRFVQAYRYSIGRDPPDSSEDEACAGSREWSEVRGALAVIVFHESFPLCEKHRDILRRETGNRGVPLPA